MWVSTHTNAVGKNKSSATAFFLEQTGASFSTHHEHDYNRHIRAGGVIDILPPT